MNAAQQTWPSTGKSLADSSAIRWRTAATGRNRPGNRVCEALPARNHSEIRVPPTLELPKAGLDMNSTKNFGQTEQREKGMGWTRLEVIARERSLH